MSRYRKQIEEEIQEEIRVNRNEIFSTAEIFTYSSKQKFAVFPTGKTNNKYDFAFDLRTEKYPKKFNSWDETENTPGDGFFPVCYQGKYWLKSNAYETKLLCYFVFTEHCCGKTKRIYTPLWLNTGWLHRHELKLSNHELSNIISDEMENSFTTTPVAAL